MAQPDSQNDVVDYESIVQILKIPYIGNENEKKIILDQQEDVYQKLILKFKDIDDDEGRLKAIEAGVAEELTNIIESRDLTSITISIIEALEYLTYPGLFKQRQLLYEKKNPYPALFRLLDHQNTDVVLHTITTIGSILQGGIGTTKESEQNPHFQSVEECGGKQKIFSLFQTTSDKVIKDKTAIFIGRLYKARAILDKDMQQSIISHLKSITSDADEWTRRNSALAINYLSQNEDNYIEIVKGFDPFAVIQDLLQPLIGNEEERKQIQNKKNLVCVLLLILLDKAEDNNLLERLTEARIIEALLYYFETQELNMIVSSPVKIFKQLQSSALTQIEQLKKEKKFYPNILRLFRSSDTELLSQAYDLIAYDFAAGADLAKDNSPNPLFQEIQECGGIEIIFDLFQRNLNKNTRNNSANLLIMLFVNQEFPIKLMRQEIIGYYINPLINSNSNGQSIEHLNLKDLAQVAGNHTEILKDNFITKAVQVMSNSSDSFLLDFLEIIIDAGTEQTREKIKQEFSVANIKDLYQHKDSNIRDQIYLFVSRINYPEQVKKLETIQKQIKKNMQDQQTNFNIHEIMNDICIAIEEASENYDEKGGLAMIGIKIVHDLIINYKETIQQELEIGKFIERLFKLFEFPYLSKYVVYDITLLIYNLINVSSKVLILISHEKNIRAIIHLLDCKDEDALLYITYILTFILLQMNQQQLNKQEIQIRDFFEKYGGLKKLIQIFQNSSYQNKLIVQYSIISIGLLHKAVKIPDEIRIAVIDEIKQMPQPGNDKEIQYLSAIVISMLAESEENHNDIIAEGFPNTILSLLTCDDPKVSYQGLTLALNLLYFGSDSTKQKVKQAVPLNVVCQLTHEMDQNDDDVMTAQLLIDWLLFLS